MISRAPHVGRQICDRIRGDLANGRSRDRPSRGHNLRRARDSGSRDSLQLGCRMAHKPGTVSVLKCKIGRQARSRRATQKTKTRTEIVARTLGEPESRDTTARRAGGSATRMAEGVVRGGSRGIREAREVDRK